MSFSEIPSPEELKVSSSDEVVEEGFSIKSFEGLRNAFVCRLCGCIFVGVTDAKRHMVLYHKVVSVFGLRKRLEELAKGSFREKEKNEEGEKMDRWLEETNDERIEKEPESKKVIPKKRRLADWFTEKAKGL
jgi:hypothetical protein